MRSGVPNSLAIWMRSRNSASNASWAPGRVNPDGYDLLSYGADGKPGGEGENADVLSWK